MADFTRLNTNPETLQAQSVRAPAKGVRPGAFALALVLIPLNVYWITVTEVRWYATDGTCLPIFVSPVVILFGLGLINICLRRFLPKLVMRQGELIITYIMLVASSALAGQDTLQNLFGSICHAEHGATPLNGWRETWFGYLPKALVVTDKHAVDSFYHGGVVPWQWDILKHWLGPLSLWGALLAVLLAMMLSITVLVRKQWTDHERLTFPLVQLPVAMTGDQGATKFYANRMMWLGFGIAAAIDIVNGLHTLYPSMPYLVGIKKCELGSMFVSRPWSALASGGIGFYSTLFPFAVGLGFFMPLDLSFSCWFFFIARKLWQVFGAARGWDATPGVFPCFEEQAGGAWVALGVLAAWGARKHFGAAWRLAWERKKLSGEELAESRLYRWAIVTFIGGAALLGVFAHYVGLAAWAALAFFGLYFILALAMTRVRAELGSPHEIYFVNPARIMVTVLGAGAIGVANLTVISAMYWFNRCYRSHPMPGQIEAFKLSDGAKLSPGKVVGAIALASFVGIIASYWANLQVTYSSGAEAKCYGVKGFTGVESYWWLTTWLKGNQHPETARILQVLAGAAAVMVLSALRGAFIWWPFHPAGYALAISFAMDFFWLPFLVAWMVKLFATRYGGMKLHNRIAPVFLGLILGDFTMGFVWSTIGAVFGVQTYKIWI